MVDFVTTLVVVVVLDIVLLIVEVDVMGNFTLVYDGVSKVLTRGVDE